MILPRTDPVLTRDNDSNVDVCHVTLFPLETLLSGFRDTEGQAVPCLQVSDLASIIVLRVCS